MHDSLSPLFHQFNLQTNLFVNCLADVTDDIASFRPNDRTNSLGFVATHLVDARYFMSTMFGLSAEKPFPNLDSAAGIEQIDDLPTVDEILVKWIDLSQAFQRHLRSVELSLLGEPAPHDFPFGDDTLLGGFGFLLHHEAYHLGQMGLLRKYFHLEAMSYDEPDLDQLLA